MSRSSLLQHNFTEEQKYLRRIFKKSYWLTVYLLCGFNEQYVKKTARGSGLDYAMNWRLHKSVCNILQFKKWTRFIVLLPRGYFKSSMITIGYTVWRIINNPDIRIAIATGNEERGKSFIAAIQNILDSTFFRAAFPEIVDGIKKQGKGSVWSTTKFTVNRTGKYAIGEPTVTLITWKSVATSQHYDLIIFNDVVNRENSLSATEREAVKNFVRNANPLLSNQETSQILMENTRWHLDDACGMLLENPYYNKLVMSITDDNGEPTFPEKYPLEIIPKLKQDCETAKDFAANYMNNPVSEELTPMSDKKLYINYHEIEKENEEKFRCYIKKQPDGSAEKVESNDKILATVAALDTAKKSGLGRDNDAIVVASKDVNGNIFIPYAKLGKWTGSQRIKELEFIDSVFNLLAIGIEESGQYDINAALGDMAQRGNSFINTKLRPLSHGSMEKSYRCKLAIEPYLRDGKIFFHHNLPQDFFLQLQLFPEYPLDDYVDALAYCIMLFRELGILERGSKCLKFKGYKPIYQRAAV